MAIVYDVTNNIITVTGYTEGVPCTFNDIYNADKAGILSIHNRIGIAGVDGAPVAVDRALRPTDYVMLGGTCNDLYIVITNWTGGMVNATIQIVGTDRCGNAVTTNVVVNGNGTFQITDWYATITSTQVTVWNGGGGDSFDYNLIQGQWGVVWKQGDVQFLFDAKLAIGDSAGTETWFADTKKQVEFSHSCTTGNWQWLSRLYKNSHFRLGEVIDVSKKETKYGCEIIYTGNRYSQYIITAQATAPLPDIELYSSKLVGAGTYGYYHLVANIQTGTKIWNCIFDGCYLYQSYGIDIFNVLHSNALYIRDVTGTVEKMTIYRQAYAFAWSQDGQTVRDIYIRDITTNTFYCWATGSDPIYLINIDSDSWTFKWGAVTILEIRRQYEFNRKILLEDGSAYAGKDWTIKDKDGNVVASGNTQADGKLSATDLAITRGYFNRANGDTEQLYSPFDLWVDGETDYLDLNIYKIPMDNKDVEGIETMVSVTAIVDGINDIKGTGFVKDTHSLTNIEGYVDNIPTVEAKIDIVDTVVDAIKAVTDNLPDVGALTTLITHLTDIKGAGWTNENLTTLDALIDGIKTVTDNLPDAGALTSLINHLTDIKGAGWTNENLTVMDALLDALRVDATRILQILGGRWLIKNNQLIYYANDGVTPLYTFNLRDSSGQPAEKNVYERIPV